jgi:hypothetical protein
MRAAFDANAGRGGPIPMTARDKIQRFRLDCPSPGRLQPQKEIKTTTVVVKAVTMSVQQCQ